MFEVLYRASGLELRCGYCRGIDFLESKPTQLRIVGGFQRASSVSFQGEWAVSAELQVSLSTHRLSLLEEASWMKQYFPK